MARDDRIGRLYRWLVRLYPRGFRARFGESMLQTFRDMERHSRRGTLVDHARLVIWVFVETVIGVGREHLLVAKDAQAMKILGSDVRNSAGIGLILVAPLLLLELFKGSGLTNTSDAWALFGSLYLLAAAFLIVLTATVRHMGSRDDDARRMFRLLVGGTAFVLLAGVWLLIVADQLPCFMGVPYCD